MHYSTARHFLLPVAPLLATALLLGTLGCSHKADPAAVVVGNGSYSIDGRAVECEATAKLYTPQANSTLRNDQLYLTLVAVLPNQGNREALQLTFQKPSNDPSAVYKLDQLLYFQDGLTGIGQVGVGYTADSFVINPSSGGGYSGTFEASGGSRPGGGPASVIRRGIFTDVRP